jgi:predicted DNA binding CopG/RHH family protein
MPSDGTLTKTNGSYKMNQPKLSREEKQFLDDFEAGEFRSVLTPERKKMLQAIAENTFEKDKRINIMLSSRDRESLQRRALEEGIPYQTLVSSVLHKYVSGGLHDVMANKEFQRS